LEDNIKMDLKKTECDEWIHLAQNRDQWWALLNTVMNFPVHIKCGKFIDQLSYY
jgi:hypothetical protein